jgi:hypothetical protein
MATKESERMNPLGSCIFSSLSLRNMIPCGHKQEPGRSGDWQGRNPVNFTSIHDEGFVKKGQIPWDFPAFFRIASVLRMLCKRLYSQYDESKGGTFMSKALNPQQLRFIEEAANFLEKPSALVKATDRLGKPLDKLQDYLPQPVQQLVKQALNHALKSALQAALKTLPAAKVNPHSWDEALNATRRMAWTHTAAVTTTGAIGGALGTAAMLVELPLTTSLILRSISSMAQQWGHDLRHSEIQMQCLYVFTLGSPKSSADDEMDAAYISARLAYHGLIRELASFIATHSVKDVIFALEKGTFPALVKFASLFVPALERTVLRGVLTKSIPVMSAIGSAALNAAFCKYFTQAARYHFGLMHLENVHGTEQVHKHYVWACRPEKVWPEIRMIS